MSDDLLTITGPNGVVLIRVDAGGRTHVNPDRTTNDVALEVIAALKSAAATLKEQHDQE